MSDPEVNYNAVVVPEYTGPYALWCRLTSAGFKPLPAHSEFVKAREKAREEEEDELEQFTGGKKPSRAEQLTSLVESKFPYHVTDVEQAVCFPVVFSLGHTTLSKFLGKIRDDNILELHVPFEALKACWDEVVFQPGAYHLAPLEVRTLEIDTRGVDTKLSYCLVSRRPGDSGGGGKTWTHSTQASDCGANGNVVYDGEIAGDCNSVVDAVTWRASLETMRDSKFHRLKVINYNSLIGTISNQGARKVQLPRTDPEDEKATFGDLVAWIASLELRNITQQYEDADEDEDDVDPKKMMAIPKKKMAEVLQAYSDHVQQSNTLMSLEGGLTLEITPADCKTGWNEMRNKLDRCNNARGRIGVHEQDPEVHFSVKLGIYAIPLLATPSTETYPASTRFALGYAGRTVTEHVAVPITQC
jgi:hypothetical protein